MIKLLEVDKHGIYKTRTVDFTTTGRWKTIKYIEYCELYIEIIEYVDVSKWYQKINIQPKTKWVPESLFVEIENPVEIVNECS